MFRFLQALFLSSAYSEPRRLESGVLTTPMFWKGKRRVFKTLDACDDLLFYITWVCAFCHQTLSLEKNLDCVPVLAALLSSSYKKPSASAGAEFLEVAPNCLFSEVPPERRCWWSAFYLHITYLYSVCMGCSLSFLLAPIDKTLLVLGCSQALHLTNKQD